MAKILGTLMSLFILFAAIKTSLGTNTIVYLFLCIPISVIILYNVWFTKPWYENK